MSHQWHTVDKSTKSCKNIGVHELTQEASMVKIASDGYPSGYENDAECHWAFYAPQSQGITVYIPSFHVKIHSNHNTYF